MITTIALMVWLLLVGLDWRGDITASAKFLGTAAIIVVVIFILECIFMNAPQITKIFKHD